ncbi:hypothetical protein BKA69DRAFT_1037928 [Paraphysoderma sedebokerense]|nr:hypothetical protein BKA69DRAFT_1037928 [Paraphysoderma sedebokerense]
MSSIVRFSIHSRQSCLHSYTTKRLLYIHSFSFAPISNEPAPLPLGDREAQKQFKQLIQEREKELEDVSQHPDAEKEPLQKFPDDVNPTTGERGGPRGPEPTRFGDWERKGRVTDF